MKDSDLHWLVGLLEGEGSFYCSPMPTIAIQMTDEDVISRVANLFGVGYIQTKRQKAHHKDGYATRVRGARAADMMRTLQPLMGNRRSSQIDKALGGYVPVPHGQGNATLTTDQAREIKERHAQGESAIALAEEFNVTKWTVYAIRQGRRNTGP